MREGVFRISYSSSNAGAKEDNRGYPNHVMVDHEDILYGNEEDAKAYARRQVKKRNVLNVRCYFVGSRMSDRHSREREVFIDLRARR